MGLTDTLDHTENDSKAGVCVSLFNLLHYNVVVAHSGLSSLLNHLLGRLRGGWGVRVGIEER